MHSEVATIARAMLSAGLAVADARRQRQLRSAREAERQPHRPRRLPTPRHPTPAAGTATGTHQPPPRLERRPHRAAAHPNQNRGDGR